MKPFLYTIEQLEQKLVDVQVQYLQATGLNAFGRKGFVFKIKALRKDIELRRNREAEVQARQAGLLRVRKFIEKHLTDKVLYLIILVLVLIVVAPT